MAPLPNVAAAEQIRMWAGQTQREARADTGTVHRGDHRSVGTDRGECLGQLVAHDLVDRVELFRPIELQHNDAGLRPADEQRFGHGRQRRGSPSTWVAMMLR
jgi:hypothetical protein